MDLIEIALTNLTTVSTIELLDEYPALAQFIMVLYGVIFVVGMIGNMLVLAIVLKFKTMWNSITNRFIACLSVSDLLLCIFAVPFTPINALGDSWIFGQLMCKLVPVILVISVFVSTLTSVVIAVDRYAVIIHPFAPRMTKNMQAGTILAIWVLAASTAIPIGVYTTVLAKSVGVGYDCSEQWPNNHAPEVYTWLIFALQVVIPGLVIAICYIAICRQLIKRTRRKYAKIKNEALRMEKEQKEVKKNRRINTMLIAMVVTFVCCWLPLDVFHIFGKYIPKEYFLISFLICHIIAMSSVMYNPFLYACLNEHFAKYFRKIFAMMTPCCRTATSSDDSHDTLDQMSNTQLSHKNGHLLPSQFASGQCSSDIRLEMDTMEASGSACFESQLMLYKCNGNGNLNSSS